MVICFVTSWHIPERELQPCCHVLLCFLVSIPLSVLIVSWIFSSSMYFISQSIASTGRYSACVSWRWELHVSDLGDGCPVAASPANTTLTTDQPSKSHALSWAFQVTTAVPESYKMQKSWCYLRSSWDFMKQGQGNRWGWQSLCAPCSCSSFKASGEKPCQGEK